MTGSPEAVRSSPAMARWFAPLLLLLAAAPASGQRAPDAQALLDAWAEGWRRASRSVETVEATERLARDVDGPRGRVTIETDADLLYRRGAPPERDVRRTRVNGRDRPPRDRRLEDRLGRAVGPAGRDLGAVPRLPGVLLADADALGIEADRLGGTPAWRVDLAPRRGPDRASAWFSRDRVPRLLRLRLDGERPRGGRYERTVDYARIDGLDLAVETDTRVTVRQRRRLRQYVVVLTSRGQYGDYRVGRR